MQISEKQKIYRDFLTNSAVAWFSSGLISPMILGFRDISGLLVSVVSIIISYYLLKLAEEVIRI